MLIPSMQGVGGSEKLIDNLSCLLVRDHEVIMASFDSPGAIRYFDNNVQIHNLGPIPEAPLFLRWWPYLLSAYRLRSLKKRFRIDLTISTIWRADLINALACMGDKKIALIPINIRGNQTNRVLARMRFFASAVYRAFDRVFAISEVLTREVKELFAIPEAKIGTFSNFVPSVPQVSLFPDDGIHRYVFCARFVPEKNLEGLMQVWARFVIDRSQVQLIMIGDGPLMEPIKALALQLGLRIGDDITDSETAVVFLGALPNPMAYMMGARAFLLSSRDEGTPGVLLLALAAGLPILAADAQGGGVREVMGLMQASITDQRYEEGLCGLLLPIPHAALPSSVDTWLTALCIADGCDEKILQWRQGAERRYSKYSPEAVREFWNDSLQAVLKE